MLHCLSVIFGVSLSGNAGIFRSSVPRSSWIPKSREEGNPIQGGKLERGWRNSSRWCLSEIGRCTELLWPSLHHWHPVSVHHIFPIWTLWRHQISFTEHLAISTHLNGWNSEERTFRSAELWPRISNRTSQTAHQIEIQKLRYTSVEMSPAQTPCK